MIVYKNQKWATNSLYPNSKYDETADYWVEDDSEIATFIVNSNGYFKVTSCSENGKILSVEEDFPIEIMVKNKCDEINNMCNNAIKSGIDYNGEHYDLTDEDQINMLAWSSIAQSGSSVPYHSSGNPCRAYSSEEFLGLVQTATQFKTYHLTYCNLLKQQIANMTDIEEIKSVTYGVTQLNETYQAIMAQVLGGKVNEETENSTNSQEPNTL